MKNTTLIRKHESKKAIGKIFVYQANEHGLMNEVIKLSQHDEREREGGQGEPKIVAPNEVSCKVVANIANGVWKKGHEVGENGKEL